MQKSSRLIISILTVFIYGPLLYAEGSSWTPVQGHIMSKWAKELTPENVHPEYPRPGMVRKDWINLNGLWNYAFTRPFEAEMPEADGKILVPFPIESALSGVKSTPPLNKWLWYGREFEVPSNWKESRVLLHFGAVDWECHVWINGSHAGSHQGGYDPFTFDITDYLRPQGPQQIKIAVWDITDAGWYPRGKQLREPGGIRYTSVTGIWQTVWLEPVPEVSIQSIKITPDVDSSSVKVQINTRGKSSGFEYQVLISDSNMPVSGQTSRVPVVELGISEPRLWSPSNPHLYDLKVNIISNGEILDSVSSYFGMRKAEVRKAEDGFNRLFLNNQPLFHYGLLDQGWWPGGLYTAPSDEALKYDLEMTKRLGFNMLRKHVKVSPSRLYYWCDKLGILVWQDMPNMEGKVYRDEKDLFVPGYVSKQFELEYRRMIDALYNHPSIVMWVPFNEGWGQYDTERIARWTKQYDPTRIVNAVSGWADRGVGDVYDDHSYPGPKLPAPHEGRAAVLGEFGGLGLPVEGHLWQEKENWGYRSYKTPEELTSAYLELVYKLRPLIGRGLAAAVYTQTTDVEIEVNGLITYDRAVVKMDPELLRKAHQKLFLPPPVEKTVLPDARSGPQRWKYTIDKPSEDWMKPGFDDSNWKRSMSGFGQTRHEDVSRTKWETSDIWLRRSFELTDLDFESLNLTIWHDEDAEVYFNGSLVKKFEGHVSSYMISYLDKSAASKLREGENVIAVHCRQTRGSQYIDVGLVDLIEEKNP